MALLKARQRVRPIEYQWAWDANRAAIRSRWDHEDGVSWTSDIKNWKVLLESDKEVISGILKGFTLIENIVGCYWSRLSEEFPIPEIAAMARTFSAQEVVHAIAYQALEDNLGLDTYEAFTQDAIAVKKLNDLLGFDQENLENSLAIFSGAVEGISLFSSFAVLQSYCLDGKFNGMRQILSWSMADENLHSQSGIRLLKTLRKEYPKRHFDKEFIRKGFELVVTNENNFIHQIFKGKDLPNITLAQAVNYIRVLANEKLQELIGEDFYELTPSMRECGYAVKSWMDPLSGLGATTNDFFSASRNGTAYSSSINQDFENVDLEELWKKV